MNAAQIPVSLGAAPQVHLTALRELWVHTGTACNLSCPFCHEGSKPGDTRIEPPTLAELAPQLQAAAAVGAERFVFTGGEPLILRDIGRILVHALGLRPCLVLTNGTAPLIRRTQQLQLLAAQRHPLSFRVSIDYAEEARHDAQRGLQNFRKALQGLKLLHEQGFAVSVARQMLPGECRPDAHQDIARIEEQYRSLFLRHKLPAHLPVFAMPELGAAGARGLSLLPATPPAENVPAPLCTGSRMLLRRSGSLRLYACALVSDDERFDLGPDLGAALAAPVATVHHRCHTCRRQPVNYG